MAAGLRFILLVLTMWGFAAPAAASFGPLSNIRTRNDGSSGVSTMAYDATNRVSSAVVGGATRTFSYDARGTSETVGEAREIALVERFQAKKATAVAPRTGRRALPTTSPISRSRPPGPARRLSPMTATSSA